MTYIEIDVSSRTWVTQAANTDDEWDQDNTATASNIESATIVDSSTYNSLIYPGTAEPGDVMYLVWAEYTEGDSFSHREGTVELISIHDNYKEAMDLKKVLLGTTDYSAEVVIHGKKITMGIPWNGYFESLDCLTVESVVLRIVS